MNRYLYSTLVHYTANLDAEIHNISHETPHYYDLGIINREVDGLRLVVFDTPTLDSFISAKAWHTILCATAYKAMKEFLEWRYFDPLEIRYKDSKNIRTNMVGGKFWLMEPYGLNLVYALTMRENNEMQLVVNPGIYHTNNPIIKVFKNQVLPYIANDLKIPIIITEDINCFTHHIDETRNNNIVYDSVFEGAPLNRFINADNLTTNRCES